MGKEIGKGHWILDVNRSSVGDMLHGRSKDDIEIFNKLVLGRWDDLHSIHTVKNEVFRGERVITSHMDEISEFLGHDLNHK